MTPTQAREKTGRQARRTRILNVRLTPEEYDSVVKAAFSQGNICMAEFLRSVILATTHPVPDSSREIAEKLSLLDEKLELVLERMDASRECD